MCRNMIRINPKKRLHIYLLHHFKEIVMQRIFQGEDHGDLVERHVEDLKGSYLVIIGK